MNRRTFLSLSGAALIVPGVLRAAPLDYTPGLVDQELAAGKTLFLDWKASWCTTCAAQGRVLAALKAENPAYEKAITFINIDWDTYSNAEITHRFNIPRRSTLVVVKGNRELGRLVAQTQTAQIRELMDIALSAATS